MCDDQPSPDPPNSKQADIKATFQWGNETPTDAPSQFPARKLSKYILKVMVAINNVFRTENSDI